ncbi:MAG: hypothetical protein ACREBA_06650 [Nitrosotalea sp.]
MFVDEVGDIGVCGGVLGTVEFVGEVGDIGVCGGVLGTVEFVGEDISTDFSVNWAF